MATQTESASEGRWYGRPVLSALLRASVFITPIAISIAAATVVSRLLPRAHVLGWELAWWATVLIVPIVFLVLSDRIARKALPLAVLLQMTLVFPDRAPKRLAVARRVATTKDLARRVEEARTHGPLDEPAAAAEKILALAAALNAHDRLTRGHGERVRAYTDLIADELRLPAKDRDRLRWSALLHDIGKLTVHSHILNKADKLDDEEWALVKNHPLEGAALTAPLAVWLGPWANTIAEHHERYDGQGYPYGLSGEEISFGGRIVAVADSYDVMTTVRSYKRPMSPEAARTELAGCAGAHFDPQVVRAFLDVSIGKLRPVAGPIAWLGSLPFVSRVPQLGQVVATMGRAAVAAVVIGGSLVGATVAGGVAQARAGSAGLQRAAAPSGMKSNGIVPGTGSDRTSTGSGSGHGTKPAVQGSAGRTTTLLGGPGRTGSHKNRIGSPAGTSPSGTAPTTPGATATTSPSGTAGTTPGATATTTTQITTVTTTTSPPVQAQQGSLAIANGSSTQPGRPQQGNQIIVTYAPVPNLSLFCNAWTSTSYPQLDDSAVVVSGTQPSSGDDTITVSDSADCSGGLHFGTIDLGERGFFNTGTVTFGGSSSTCSGSNLSGCSSIQWNGVDTLTITLGAVGNGQPTQKTPSIAVYTPDPALGLLGTIKSPNEIQF